MTTEREQADWAAGVRRERFRDPVAFAVGAAYAAGVLLLRRDLSVQDPLVWIAAAVGICLAVVGPAIALRLRPCVSDVYRVRHAVRAHLDPGPALRAKADKQALMWSATGPLAWFVLIGGVLQLLRPRWDEPALALSGAALVLVAAAVAVRECRRRGAAGDRWLDDPPGPPREPRPPQNANRELVVALVGGSIVLAVLFVVAVVSS
jgi:hypothetical protein